MYCFCRFLQTKGARFASNPFCGMCQLHESLPAHPMLFLKPYYYCFFMAAVFSVFSNEYIGVWIVFERPMICLILRCGTLSNTTLFYIPPLVCVSQAKNLCKITSFLGANGCMCVASVSTCCIIRNRQVRNSVNKSTLISSLESTNWHKWTRNKNSTEDWSLGEESTNWHKWTRNIIFYGELEYRRRVNKLTRMSTK